MVTQTEKRKPQLRLKPKRKATGCKRQTEEKPVETKTEEKSNQFYNTDGREKTPVENQNRGENTSRNERQEETRNNP